MMTSGLSDRKYFLVKKILPFLLLLFVIIILPFVASGYIRHLAEMYALSVIAAVSLNLVMGYAGQASLGHAALYGVGAYTVAILTTRAGVPFGLALLMAGVLGGLAGIIMGVPSLRLAGFYLAVATMGFVIVFGRLIIVLEPITGGAMGVPDIPFPTNQKLFFYLSSALALLVFFVVLNLLKTKWGRAFVAFRESEVAAESLGLNVYKLKLVAFVVTSVMVALAGGLYAPFAGYISYESFTIWASVFFVLMILIGGIGTVYGPVIGALAMVIIGALIAPFAQNQQFVYGIILVAVVLAFPQGIVGLAKRAYTSYEARSHQKKESEDVVADTPLVKSVESGPWLSLTKGVGHASSELLVIKGAHKAFGGVKAVEDISLSVKKGSIHGLIGPNGSGKTTLINIVVNFHKADAGQFFFSGQNVTHLLPRIIAEKGLVRTFQDLKLFKSMTVLENVMTGEHLLSKTYFGESMFQLPRVRREEADLRERAFQILRFLGLGRFSFFTVDNLPYGQQKLVALARALALSPSMILLDEPAAGLSDPEMDTLMEALNLVVKQGVTLLVIEHHLRFIMKMCQVISVLHNGRKIAEGSPEEISANPRVIEVYVGKQAAV